MSFILQECNKRINLFSDFKQNGLEKISLLASIILKQISLGKKILIAGNGGSASESQHLSAELMVKFKKKRNPISAICLSSDISLITACSNDFGYEFIFERQIEGIGKKGDILILMTTSGKSNNIIKAAKLAKHKGLIVISLTGINKTLLSKYSNYEIKIQTKSTALIQEMHLFIIHTLCEILDKKIK
jgi:D-sedoheptulose 7-phosphate isomerase